MKYFPDSILKNITFDGGGGGALSPEMFDWLY